MSAIGPGDWVEYVGDGGPAARGQIYRVRSFDPTCSPCTDCGDDGPGVDLDGVSLDLPAFCGACELRPIYRPKSSLIETLKQPAPEILRELLTV